MIAKEMSTLGNRGQHVNIVQYENSSCWSFKKAYFYILYCHLHDSRVCVEKKGFLDDACSVLKVKRCTAVFM